MFVVIMSFHVMMSVPAIRVIFSRIVSQNVNFCCDFSGVTHRPTYMYFSSHPINCSNKNVCSRLFVRLCCAIQISKFETF